VLHKRVFVLVSVAAWAELLSATLEGDDRFELVGVATDGDTALRTMATLDAAPDLVLIDAGARSGTMLARTLRTDRWRVRVAVVGLDEEPGQVLMWARLGATGLVARAAPLDELLQTLEGVAEGQAPCSAGISAALLRGVGDSAQEQDRANPRHGLTEREREVALLVADGWTNKEIAVHLHIETGTVKTHVHSVIQKLGVSRRAHVGPGLLRSETRGTIGGLMAPGEPGSVRVA
jgi:DNA-binding NarL/FixJ family response regulator